MTPFSQTVVSTLKQAQTNASADRDLRQVWINLGRLRSTPHRALIYNVEGMVTGSTPGSGLGFCTILCVLQPSIYLHHWSVNSMNKFYYLGAS